MSLDATILAVERDGADLVLILGPRIDWDEKPSIAGQPRMRIVGATWTPQPGMDISGGENTVRVTDAAHMTHCYVREGYTRLREACPFCEKADVDHRPADCPELPF